MMSYRHVCFSRIKTAIGRYLSVIEPPDISKERNSSSTRGQGNPTKRTELKFHTCNLIVEVAICPTFDPTMVLQRCVFFINDEKSKYVSTGYYPARSYQILVKFGGPRAYPNTLKEQHVTTMADHLHGLCGAMCINDNYTYNDDCFRLITTGSYRVAWLYLDKQYISIKLNELRYLLNMFHVVQNQQTLYFPSLPDVTTYATAALRSSSFVAPTLIEIHSLRITVWRTQNGIVNQTMFFSVLAYFRSINWTCLNLNSCIVSFVPIPISSFQSALGTILRTCKHPKLISGRISHGIQT